MRRNCADRTMVSFAKDAERIRSNCHRSSELRGYDEWPESHAKGDFAKKLKTYRSTGDLHRLADLRKKEHDKILEEIERNNRDVSFLLQGHCYSC